MKKIYQKGAGIQGLEDLAGVKVIIRVTAAQYSINVSFKYILHNCICEKEIEKPRETFLRDHGTNDLRLP